MDTITIRNFDVIPLVGEEIEPWVREALLYIEVPEPSFCNGEHNHTVGPFTPDEARLLAARLLTAASEVERHAWEAGLRKP